MQKLVTMYKSNDTTNVSDMRAQEGTECAQSAVLVEPVCGNDPVPKSSVRDWAWRMTPAQLKGQYAAQNIYRYPNPVVSISE